MPLQKQSVNFNFQKGLDLKSDPYQVPIGNFLQLKNSVFNKAGLLQKRNGFQQLPSLPDNSYKYVNTFNGNLTAIGSSLATFSSPNSSWHVKGSVTPIDLSVLPLVRNSSNQVFVDSAVASNGYVCTVYTSSSPSTAYNYVVADSVTGQNIVAPTALVTPGESPRVFVLGNYFVIVYSEAGDLKYVALPVDNPGNPVAETIIVINYAPGATELAFDGYVTADNLYLAYNATDIGGAIRMTYLNSFLQRQTANTGANVANAKSADIMSVTADETQAPPIIWVNFHKNGVNGYALAVHTDLSSVLAADNTLGAGLTYNNITSVAKNSICYLYAEQVNVYSFDSSIPTNLVVQQTITQSGSTSGTVTVSRSVGLASKAFIQNGVNYMLMVYQSDFQSTYFLMNSSGNVVSKLAYSNAGGYLTKGLPGITHSGDSYYIGYLFKDLITPVNKNTNVSSTTQVDGIYAQLGVNLASFKFTSDQITASEIGSNLNIATASMQAFDGFQVTEQGFNLYPDLDLNSDGTYHGISYSNGSGNVTKQIYFYVAVYEWTDNQGNIFRSAPSVPVKLDVTGAGSDSNTVTFKVPTLRITNKTLVKITAYRWSTTQQIYYQVTSISSPTLNNKAVDSVDITDAASDSNILGNEILYTTGGVLENIAPPPTKVMTLFKSRLFLVDAEDRNLLWYSKQVIEATPVEMSDLFTIFVAPTTSAQGNTGPITALSSMDDKLIIFKQNAIYYIVGDGPDNTGANNNFSDPVFITSTVGSIDEKSIVFIPSGLMFQSDKGVWLLGRDLSTTYIGAAVEGFNSSIVNSSLTIPGTNQVRFGLNTGEVLMYDYYYGQWGEFTGIPSISSTLFQDLHTFINSSGHVFQERPGFYLDGSNPVLIQFQTGWFNLAGLSGYERIYDFILLATFFSPHKLVISTAYDYSPFPSHQTVYSPPNYSGTYGSGSTWGLPSPYGGMKSLEEPRVHTQRQLCQSFQISVNEIFDSQYNVQAGAGFTMSGVNCRVGLKKSARPIRAANTVG